MTIEQEMTIEEKRNPAMYKSVFECPHCGSPAYHHWEKSQPVYLVSPGEKPPKPKKTVDKTENLNSAECRECRKISVWMNRKMIYPIQSLAPKPVINMHDDVKEIYEEARLVSIHSPRAAAVLLRVATERLTVHLGEPEGKLNTRIKNLAKKERLDERVIRSFHVLRVTANEGAHDGLMNLTGAEGAKAVDDLFFAINYIIEKTITEPKKLDQMFGDLPEDKREGVKNRDKPKETQ